MEVSFSIPLIPWEPLSPRPLLVTICFPPVLKGTSDKLWCLKDHVPMSPLSQLLAETPSYQHHCRPPLLLLRSHLGRQQSPALVFPGLEELQGVLVLIGICPPSLVADFQSTTVISQPKAKGTTNHLLNIYCILALMNALLFLF